MSREKAEEKGGGPADVKEAEFGFIGTGNMGGALARAIARGKSGDSGKILLSNRTREKADALAEELRAVCAGSGGSGGAGDGGAARSATVDETAGNSRFLFLGVKPQTLPDLLARISPILRGRKARGKRTVAVTMAAGTPVSAICAGIGDADFPVIRIMPNTPVAVGEGMILYTANAAVTETELADFTDSLAAAGRLSRTSEAELDAAGVLTGCGPAFAFMFVEAMAQAGESLGLGEEKARLYAEQTVFGAAKLALATGKAPDELKKAVCSPGGTTIEGVKVLEKEGLAASVSAAFAASYARTLELAGKKPPAPNDR